ncbi:AbgT family transporter, partial [Escherichia coli]|uniref:AbgT family transporter n=1 Tax=Escherichia coli TaxID=562 RepID=UPI00397593D3
ADRNRSHWSTSKTPSYTKSVSWHHHPMFMLLGFHPAFAQILFRIADSSVLPLAPVSPFVPLFLGFLQRYKPDAKLGTYYSLVLPYPLIFLVVWLLMLLAWYLVGLPIGPGIYPRLS